MTASVRATLLAALAARLGTLAGSHAGLVVEVDRAEGEAVDHFPTLVLVTDERAGDDDVIAEDLYARVLTATPVVVGWVRGAGRDEARAAADRLAGDVSRLVCPITASLGPGWIDTMDKPPMIGAAAASTDAVVSFQLPLIVTYQHAPSDPADPAV